MSRRCTYVPTAASAFPLPLRLAVVLALGASLLVGCGDDDGPGSPPGEGGADTAEPDSMTFPDTEPLPDAATPDVTTPDTQLPDGSEPDTGGEDTAGQPDGEEGGDAEDTGGPDDTSGPDATPDGGGFQTDLPPGSPCGPAIGTCAVGSSCIEVEAGSPDTSCFEDSVAGEPCGPGEGQCVEGTKCAAPAPGEPPICLEEAGEGASCLPESVTCAAGLTCVASQSVAGFLWLDTLAELSGWGDSSGIGRLAVDSDAGHLYAAQAPGDRVLRYDLATGAEAGTITTAAGASLLAPAGVACRRDLDLGALLIADTGQGRGLHSPTGQAPFEAFGEPGEAVSLFGSGAPADVALVDVQGMTQIWATDPSKGLVYRYEAEAPFKYQSAFDGGEVPFGAPTGLFSDGVLVYVVDTGAAQVRITNGLGLWLGAFGGPDPDDGALTAPTDVACDATLGICVVTEPDAGRLAVFDAEGAYRFDLDGPEGAWAPAGVAFHAGLLYASDATSGKVYELQPFFDSLCRAPLGLGVECGTDATPCTAGLQCLPADDLALTSLCQTVAGQGQPCGKGFVACAEGLQCVAGTATAGYAATCLPASGIGQPCGPGLAGCAPGLGCNWDGPLHQSRLCYPQAADGEPCNVYQQGGCQPGSSCELATLGDTLMICRPRVQLGEPCGQGVASCQPGLSCAAAGNVVDRVCQPNGQVGDPCGAFVPSCAPGTVCNWTDATQTAAACLPNDNAVGELCGGPGEGFCADEGASCISLDASGVNNMCMVDGTAEGETCSGFGVPACTNGTSCIIDSYPNPTSASCYGDGAPGAPCGAAFGLCDKELGGACWVTDAAALTGDCRPVQPLFAVCGPSLGEAGTCDDGAAGCACENPFVGCEPGTGNDYVCVPNVDYFELCASQIFSPPGAPNPYETGFVGLCPAASVCQIAAVGPTMEAVEWGLYMCKPTVASGQGCGLFNACQDGFTCTCSGAPCGVDQILTGNVGTCLPTGP